MSFDWHSAYRIIIEDRRRMEKLGTMTQEDWFKLGWQACCQAKQQKPERDPVYFPSDEEFL